MRTRRRCTTCVRAPRSRAFSRRRARADSRRTKRLSEELTRLSASRLAALIRRREVSPVEVVAAYLRRIEKLNPLLNAVVTLAPDAIERAREVETRLTRGDDAGALAGVPVTVKDTFETAGLRTTFGSRLFAEHVPAHDAEAVARLRESGAVIIGKTNAAELALDYTADNMVFGRTNNPFDFERTPGGSSGGCAAAVAACLTAASLGSDLVGSLRIPAHFCGVASFRPTAFGERASVGHLPPFEPPFSRGASAGAIARTVEDVILLDSVLGEGVAASRVREQLEKGGLEVVERGLRVVRAAFYMFDGATQVTKETRASVEVAARALDAVGMNVSEETPPHVGRATELWLALFSSATREFVGRLYAGREELAGRAARAVLERPLPATEDAQDEAWRTRDALRAELLRWLEETPVIVCPVGAVPALRHDAGRKIEVEGREMGAFRAFSYAQAFNVFDLPAVCVPVGVSPEGLPLGVQVAGHPEALDKVFAAALIVEEASGGWRGVAENLSKAAESSV
ncbi:MAG TPA: amidase [Pyrinomonadaceae bacterium]|nr:amidase [Pyrinomonadaceae bacterium]